MLQLLGHPQGKAGETYEGGPLVRILLLCCCIGLLAAVEVRLQPPTQVVPETLFACQLVVENSQRRVIRISVPEDVPGVAMEWKPGRKQTTSTIINGKVSHTSTYTLHAMVDLPLGPAVLPGVEVRFDDGSTLTTPPVPIEVTRGDPRLTGAGYAECRFIPDQVVPGQVAVLQYDLYVKPQSGLQLGTSTVEPPRRRVPRPNWRPSNWTPSPPTARSGRTCRSNGKSASSNPVSTPLPASRVW